MTSGRGMNSTMNAWIELPDREYDEAWSRFDRQFAFKPSTRQWPAICEPHPSITYQLPQPWTGDDEDDLHRQVLAAFRMSVPPNGRLYALDWQHPGYWFYPHVSFDQWAAPVLPNGDYYIFLTDDFSFGLFGHPWEWTICVFGQPLLAAFTTYRPRLFSSVKRSV